MNFNFKWLGQYNKAIAAVVGAALSVILASLIGDQAISLSEWVNVGIASVAAFQVWYFANHPAQPQVKAVLAALAAALVAVNSFVSDGGITAAEWIQVAIAALTAAGVYHVPNKVPKQPAIES
jgi:hypothetical protein